MLIIATVGPSTKEKRVLKDILQVGANSLRFNFSHGSIEEFDEIIKIAREIKEDIHIVQDLSGSKIRVSNKLNYIIKIYNGEIVTFCGEDIYKDKGYKHNFNSEKIIPLNVPNSLLQDKNLLEISMKDKTMIFKIQSMSNQGIKAKVIRGGIIRAGKGCNIKGFSRENMILSDIDMSSIDWGINNNVDVICQSFVEDKEDINKVKKYINTKNIIGNIPKIWAKIESPKGISNLESIIDSVDGVLIGRGDLVPEGSLIKTPIYQEEIVSSLIGKNKEIIIGTHLLNSMKSGRNPEVPEVEGIYNHIKSGVTGFLLAGETSVGRAPIKTVEFLKKLIDNYKV